MNALALSPDFSNQIEPTIDDWIVGGIEPRPTAIPPSWSLVTLTDVAKLESGHTPSRRRPTYWNGSIPWVSLYDVAALDEPAIYTTKETISKQGLANSSTRLLPAGTIIFSRTASIGKATILGVPMCTTQDFANYVCGPELHNRYLMYLFRYMKRTWTRLMAGSTHNTIYMPAFQRLQILLPPIKEQHAIDEALTDADALISSLDRLISKKRDLKQATMQELLTGKVRLPGLNAKWRQTPLGSLGTFLKGSGIRKDEAQSGTLPCIRYGEIYTTHHDHIRIFTSWISRSVADTALRLKKGDLLFAGSGETKEEIGKCVAFLRDQEAYAGGDIVVLRPEEGCSEFLGYYLNTPAIAAQKASRGQGDAVVHISSRALASLEVVLPSDEEQSAIASIIFDMDAELAALQAQQDKARAVKQGMMQELLTGRIRLL